MKWNERLQTKITVGQKYLNRNGKTVIVKQALEGCFLVDTENGFYSYPGYTNGYVVTEFGAFGSYPNGMDLVCLVSN